MEVPRLGVESELQVPDHSIATVMPQLAATPDLYPQSKARDRTRIFMDEFASRHRQWHTD